MEKVIYARVPDHVHDYIMRQAEREGLSMGGYMRRLIQDIIDGREAHTQVHTEIRTEEA